MSEHFHYEVNFIRSRQGLITILHSYVGVLDWVYKQMLEQWDILEIKAVPCYCPQEMIDAEPVPPFPGQEEARQ